MFLVTSFTTTEKLHLLSEFQDSDCNLVVFSDYHHVRSANMRKWIRQFLLAGLAGIMRPNHNHRYSKELKIAACKDYLAGELSNQEILAKYQIRNNSQLYQWVIRYNSDKLSCPCTTRKRVRKMGRKVTFDEKKQIVQWILDHDKNYQAAAEKYNVSYQRVYAWVRKYQQSLDWQALKDNRGRNKNKEPTTEIERLKRRIRELEAREREREVQIAFSKKLIEIRNREVHRPDDIKRFRK